MMPTFLYRFALTIIREDGSSLGAVPIQRDWELAVEWTRFHFQRRGTSPLDGKGTASILPRWDKTLGEPYCHGYRIEIAGVAGSSVGYDFPTTHFREFARTVASVFVEKQQLREGELYSYLVVAYPAPPQEPAPAGLSVTNSSPMLPAKNASLASFLARSTPSGVIDSSDVPVFVTRQVLEEAAERTRAEEGTETGGILIGMLWRDADAGEIFVEVTAQIPAEHTTGSNVKLSFTPQTWAAAEAALQLRGRGELYLGYYHSHPVTTWCNAKGCTFEQQRSCPLAKDFFSADDEAVMRAVFPRAYSIAIVANDAISGLTFSMFGNRNGTTQPRGFYVEEKNSGT